MPDNGFTQIIFPNYPDMLRVDGVNQQMKVFGAWKGKEKEDGG